MTDDGIELEIAVLRVLQGYPLPGWSWVRINGRWKVRVKRR